MNSKVNIRDQKKYFALKNLFIFREFGEQVGDKKKQF